MEYDFCSGVLPYTLFNNSIFFLLGKSRRTGRLITFSGKNMPSETPQTTAAREFFEETLGAVMDKPAMLALLPGCEHVLHSTTPRGRPCTTYVVHIPYRRFYTLCFAKTRTFLEQANFRCTEYLEMCDIKWVCAYSFMSRVRRQWERHGTLTNAMEWDKLLDLCNKQGMQWQRDQWRSDDPCDSHDDAYPTMRVTTNTR